MSLYDLNFVLKILTLPEIPEVLKYQPATALKAKTSLFAIVCLMMSGSFTDLFHLTGLDSQMLCN